MVELAVMNQDGNRYVSQQLALAYSLQVPDTMVESVVSLQTAGNAATISM
jgi:hypothetical protein